MKRVCILYLTAGIGHKKVAYSIYHKINSDPSLSVEIKDALQFGPGFIKTLYSATYLFMIKRATFLWSFLYYFLDLKIVHMLLYPLRIFLNWLTAHGLIDYLKTTKPDMVISTHFLPADVIQFAGLKKKNKLLLANVMTDYKAHAFWVNAECDLYFVADEFAKKDLVDKWGIDGKKIYTSGIPVENKFYHKLDKALVRDKFGIDRDGTVALFVGGGYGIGPIVDILRDVESSALNVTFIVVCGKNRQLIEKVRKFKNESKLKIIEFEFVDNIDELMAAADFYIGKSGGITVTEAINKNLPLLVINPIPGQETRNAEWLVSKKIGCMYKKRKISQDFSAVLSEFVSDIGAFKDRLQKIECKDASAYIGETIKNMGERI